VLDLPFLVIRYQVCIQSRRLTVCSNRVELALSHKLS